MFKIGLAGFIHETNTFSQTPTPLENFLNQSGFYPELCKGEDIFKFAEGRYNIAASGFFSVADELGFEVAPLVWCGTEPSGSLPEDVFDTIMGMIEESLKEKGPFDGLFLDLHGAMVYGDLQDGETEILRRVRKIVGNIPIVCSLDLHGNISKECFELATMLIGYRTYPHVDGFENGVRCALALRYVLDGNPLVKAYRQSPFLMPATTQPTTREPAKSLYEMIPWVEQVQGVVSATIMEGFNAVDLPHTGPSVFTYGVDKQRADWAVESLLQGILDREPQFSVDLYPPEEAVQKAMRIAENSSKPVILADIQDNAGGGSTSDTVWILQELVNKHARGAALGLLWDPEAAEEAHQAGEGAMIELALGGKSLPGHTPFEASFLVEKVFEGDFLGTGPMVKDREMNLGKMAQLKIDDVRVVVSSDRMQALDQSFFRVVGIEPAEMKILALKSANHYRADFGPIAEMIINVDAPGAIVEDPSKISYRNLREGVRLKGLGPVYRRP